MDVSCRMMRLEDVGSVPIDHLGSADEVRSRIRDLGSSAVLAFDAEQHVAQLGFRRYEPGLRSPLGLMDPLYWGDFSGVSVPELPDATLNLFCYHVGQLREGDERDARYQGQGIGLKLLDVLLDWADAVGFQAVVAKGVPPVRPVAVFMGGHPASTYEERGFETVTRWIDPELRQAIAERQLAADLDSAAEVALCVRR
jgi:GNAT superfamily N-acetyltransferase